MKLYSIVLMLVASTSAIRMKDEGDLILPPIADQNDIDASKHILAQQEEGSKLATED